MKFKLDENIPPQAVDVFTANDLDAESVRDEGLTGCSDDHLISVCTDESRILVTLDLDFSDIRRYPPPSLNGIVIIRTEKQSRNHIISIIERIMNGKLMIVEDNRIRIR